MASGKAVRTSPLETAAADLEVPVESGHEEACDRSTCGRDVPGTRMCLQQGKFSVMASAPRPLVAGNWKMNGLKTALAQAQAVQTHVSGAAFKAAVDVMLCPPATLVLPLAQASSGSRLTIGGQDCHAAVSGAHTGDISAEMLKDAGAAAVIVGHSERRADHGELDSMVQAKAAAAHRAGLMAIVCVGETAGQRQSGLTLDVVGRQSRARCPRVRRPPTRSSPTSRSGRSAPD